MVARTRVAQQLGINKDTLRNWVEREQIDTGMKPGVTTADQQRINQLERENRELRRANEILKTASAFLAAELDRPHKRWSRSSTPTATSSESSRSAER